MANQYCLNGTDRHAVVDDNFVSILEQGLLFKKASFSYSVWVHLVREMDEINSNVAKLDDAETTDFKFRYHVGEKWFIGVTPKF